MPGNSFGEISYTTTDAKPFNGNNYYRLEQQDLDGRSIYSNVILIKNSNTFSMRMNNIYPNPARKVFYINWKRRDLEEVTLELYNLQGIKVFEEQLHIDNFHSLNLNQPAGTYFVTVTDINSCTGSSSATLTVNANPIVNVSPASASIREPI